MSFEDWTEYLYKTLYSKYGNKMDEYIIGNKNFSIKYIENNFLRICAKNFVNNPHIKFDKYINYKKENINYTNMNIYKDELERMLDLHGDYEYIKLMEKEYNHKINYTYLSMNNNITWDMIKSYKNEEWYNNALITYNKNITLDIVIDNLYFFDKENIKNISKNESVKWKDVINHPEIEWNYKDLSLNSNITFDIVLKNLDKKWCFRNLSYNKNITLEIIKKYPEFNWCMYGYIQNPNLMFNELEELKIFKNYSENMLLYYISLGNYDKERDKYFINNNIIIDENTKNILNKKMYDYNYFLL